MIHMSYPRWEGSGDGDSLLHGTSQGKSRPGTQTNSLVERFGWPNWPWKRSLEVPHRLRRSSTWVLITLLGTLSTKGWKVLGWTFKAPCGPEMCMGASCVSQTKPLATLSVLYEDRRHDYHFHPGSLFNLVKARHFLPSLGQKDRIPWRKSRLEQ